jgi:hypothetical protein
MNERIKELAKQAETLTDEATNAFKDDTGNWQNIWNEVYDEKFAELIVRECASKAWFAEQYGIGDGTPVSKQIKEHFGVEE